jgi:hypothetical protein
LGTPDGASGRTRLEEALLDNQKMRDIFGLQQIEPENVGIIDF